RNDDSSGRIGSHGAYSVSSPRPKLIEPIRDQTLDVIPRCTGLTRLEPPAVVPRYTRIRVADVTVHSFFARRALLIRSRRTGRSDVRPWCTRGPQLTFAVPVGEVSLQTLDAAVIRSLRLRICVGLFLIASRIAGSGFVRFC